MINKWYRNNSFKKYPSGLFGLSQPDDIKKSEAELQIARWKAEAVGTTASKLKERAKKEWYKPYGQQLQVAAKQAEERTKGIEQEVEHKQKEVTTLKTVNIANKLLEEAQKLNTKESAERAKIAALQAAKAAKEYGDMQLSQELEKQTQELEKFIQETIKAEVEYEAQKREYEAQMREYEQEKRTMGGRIFRKLGL